MKSKIGIKERIKKWFQKREEEYQEWINLPPTPEIMDDDYFIDKIYYDDYEE